MRAAIAAISVSILASQTAYAQTTPEQHADEVQKYYKNVTRLQADFSQDVDNAICGKKTTSTGRIYAEPTGKMRWDYETPSKVNWISDGKTLWIAEHDAKQ